MKRLNVLLATLMLFVAVGINAQKIATMDVLGIINAMPEKIKADKQLEAFSKAKQKILEDEGEKIQALYQKYSKEAPSQTAEVNKKREAEMQQKAKAFDQKKVAIQQEIIAKQNEAFAPVEKKFNAAVAKVATANGYEYIMDAASTSLIYKNGPDATAAVKEALGL